MVKLDEITSILSEFAWCENADQKVGAMAAEIRHLRTMIEDLQHDAKQLSDNFTYYLWGHQK